jgi:hypothetical protein
MATSDQTTIITFGDTTSQGKTNKGKGRSVDQPEPNTSDKGRGKLLTTQNQTYASDTTDEFQSQITSLLVESAKALETSYLTAGENQEVRPWRSERSGEVLHIWVPTGISSSQTAAMLILHLAARLDTVVLHASGQSYTEPEWTSEVTRRLSGMIATLLGSPDSFASSSSPVDLTRLALWVSAIQTALSKPGGVKTAVGTVLPEKIGGADSANKYLARGWAAMRACITDEDGAQMVKTIEQLFKLWSKKVEGPALQLLRKQKISWGAVLAKGAQWETIKVKKNTVRRILIPVKPNRSPFISGKERTLLGRFFEADWSTCDELREQFINLEPFDQHNQFGDYVTKVTQAFQEMKRISSSVHAALGHRKKWIEAACRAQSVAPSSKKDKTNLFVWSQNFFKLDLTGLRERVKLVFNPSHYLAKATDGIDEKLNELHHHGGVIDGARCAEILPEETVLRDMFVEWCVRFRPNFNPQVPLAIVDAQSNIADENVFSVLHEESA